MLEAQYKGGSQFIRGMVIAFHGKYIPSGWALCNGTNGTPDLIGRFVMGSTVALNGVSSGAASVVLSVSNMPDHSHTFTTDSNGAHVHFSPFVESDGVDDFYGVNTAGYGRIANRQTTNTGDHTHTGSTASTGSRTSFSVLNPNLTMVYIMKL